MITKAIVFDYDGTLTRVKKGYNSWRLVWEAIGREDEQIYHLKKYLNKEYTYNQWLEICFEIYKNSGVNKDLFSKLASKSILINGLEDTLKYLTDKGIKLYILSGGIKNIINCTLNDLAKYFTSIEGNEFGYDEFEVINSVISIDHDISDKRDFVQRVLDENRLNPSELLFIGNGNNDETVYKTKVRTLCLNADDADYTNKMYWDNYIFTDDIRDIIKFL